MGEKHAITDWRIEVLTRELRRDFAVIFTGNVSRKTYEQDLRYSIQFIEKHKEWLLLSI